MGAAGQNEAGEGSRVGHESLGRMNFGEVGQESLGRMHFGRVGHESLGNAIWRKGRGEGRPMSALPCDVSTAVIIPSGMTHPSQSTDNQCQHIAYTSLNWRRWVLELTLNDEPA